MYFMHHLSKIYAHIKQKECTWAKQYGCVATSDQQPKDTSITIFYHTQQQFRVSSLIFL